MDTPIPREVEQRLPRPLRPSKYEPVAPPRKRGRRGRVELQEFDPYLHHGNRIITNYQNELLDLFNQPIKGVEVTLGRRYIRWFLSQGLEENLTPTIMGKFREKVDTACYIRYIYAIKIRNIEDGTIMVYYMRKRGSPWMNTFAEAENWLNEQENGRLSLENIERPDRKWVFVEFFNVDVKVVLDRQPLLGTGPLPDWLRNLGRERAGPMVALDTYKDNLCLWRCIADHRGTRPDRSTQTARELAKSSFKLDTAPNDLPKTSLDELDKVERYLNHRKVLAHWLGIRVFEPECEDGGEMIWHLRRNPSSFLQNILTIGIYEGQAFFIKNIEKLGKKYLCIHCFSYIYEI